MYSTKSPITNSEVQRINNELLFKCLEHKLFIPVTLCETLFHFYRSILLRSSIQGSDFRRSSVEVFKANQLFNSDKFAMIGLTIEKLTIVKPSVGVANFFLLRDGKWARMHADERRK